MNPSLEEYGTESLKKHLINSSPSIQSIVDDIILFSEGHPRSNDITVVMVEAES